MKGNPSEDKLPYRRDWISRITAAVLLGFSLAFGLSWIFVLLASGMASNARLMLAIWLFMAIWLFIITTCFHFRSSRRSWFCLAVSNAVVYVLVGFIHLLLS